MKKSKDQKTKHEQAQTDEKQPSPAETAAETAPELSKDQFLRLQADFENFRKRVSRERNEWYQRANEDLMTEILPVLDHFEMGLKTAEEHDTDSSVLAGFRLVYEQLVAALRKFGLTAVDAEGETFDPHRHEAVTHLPSEEHPEDAVVAQTRRGYLMGDKLIRAAQVVVSSGPQAAETAGAGESAAAPGEEEA